MFSDSTVLDGTFQKAAQLDCASVISVLFDTMVILESFIGETSIEAGVAKFNSEIGLDSKVLPKRKHVQKCVEVALVVVWGCVLVFVRLYVT